MIVVADTTPFISLLKAERLDILEPLFREVLIPQAVFDELTSNIFVHFNIIMSYLLQLLQPPSPY